MLRWLGASLVALPLAASAATLGLRTGDAALVQAIKEGVPRIVVADQTAAQGRSTPEAVQALYDAARDLEEALSAAAPITSGCVKLRDSARALIRGAINEAEGVDRRSAALLTGGARRVAAARALLGAGPWTCSGGHLVVTRREFELLEPLPGEAFLGRLRARVPESVSAAELFVNGQRWRTFPISGPFATIVLRAPSGPYELDLRLLVGARVVKSETAHGTWLLPPTAQIATPATRPNRDLSARLAALANSFAGQSAMWVQDLRTGAFGSWNSDARFPAASTVKLAVLIAALRRFGPRPERSSIFYELRTLGGWSSNVAANRLLVKLGGSESGGTAIAQQELTRLGATSSTYTGDYRVGTSVRAPSADAPDPPPLVSPRVTTARDLAHLLFLLDAAAMGKPDALRTTGLTRHEALVGLRVLLASHATGDNLGLFRPWLAPDFPMAQKNGWLHDARHTAAILYATDGPKIVVLLTYRVGETRAQAALLGRSVLAVAMR